MHSVTKEFSIVYEQLFRISVVFLKLKLTYLKLDTCL